MSYIPLIMDILPQDIENRIPFQSCPQKNKTIVHSTRTRNHIWVACRKNASLKIFVVMPKEGFRPCQSFFWYDTNYRCVLDSLHRLYNVKSVLYRKILHGIFCSMQLMSATQYDTQKNDLVKQSRFRLTLRLMYLSFALASVFWNLDSRSSTVCVRNCGACSCSMRSRPVAMSAITLSRSLSILDKRKCHC